MIDRWLRQADAHPRQLRFMLVFWAACALFFGVGGAVFAASSRHRSEGIAPWWFGMAAVGLAVAGLIESTRRAVKNRAGGSTNR
jgi:hypothetical protein